jgi:SAM-dependent methyltransferase
VREEGINRLLIRQYLASGQIPWSPGYQEFRERFAAETLADPELMSRFRCGQSLPSGYGVGLDERCVEYPWVFAHVGGGPKRVLDAGSTLNYEYLLSQPVWDHARLHIVTLAPEDACHWKRGISYLFEDLRDLPIRDDHYDLIVSISTLEHVGFDTSMFTGDGAPAEIPSGDFVRAMREMRRVLRPSARLLLTVPFGRYRNIGTQQVFNANLLDQAIDAFEPASVTRYFFKYTAEGWQSSALEACRECEYVDWVMVPEEVRSPEFPVQADRAAAARAVACVILDKPGRHVPS